MAVKMQFPICFVRNSEANNAFWNTNIKDSDMSAREQGAMIRSGFRTMGDICMAAKNADELLAIRVPGKNGAMVKVRNLGKGTAEKVIPSLFREYVGHLDNKDLQSVMNHFAALNADIISRMPELALITMNVNLFRDFVTNEL